MVGGAGFALLPRPLLSSPLPEPPDVTIEICPAVVEGLKVLKDAIERAGN